MKGRKRGGKGEKVEKKNNVYYLLVDVNLGALILKHVLLNATDTIR